MAAIKVEVKAMDIEAVKQLTEALIDFSKDERIPDEVRKELCNRVNAILEG